MEAFIFVGGIILVYYLLRQVLRIIYQVFFECPHVLTCTGGSWTSPSILHTRPGGVCHYTAISFKCGITVLDAAQDLINGYNTPGSNFRKNYVTKEIYDKLVHFSERCKSPIFRWWWGIK